MTIKEVLTHYKTRIRQSFRLLVALSGFLGFIVIITGYGVSAVYYKGYFSYFHIQIEDTPFYPSVMNFVTISVSFMMALLLIAATFAAMYLIPRIAMDFASTIPITWVRRITQKFVSFFAIIPRPVFLVGIFVLPFLVGWYMIYNSAFKVGFAAAEEKHSFTEVVGSQKAEHTLDLVIYQNDSVLIVKKFDQQTRQFHDDYSVISAVDKSYRLVSIDK